MDLARLSSFPEIQENVVSNVTGNIQIFTLYFQMESTLRVKMNHSHPTGWFAVNMCCFKMDLKTLWRIQRDHTYWTDETLMNIGKQ